ncbi:MAG: hypothetical protein JSV88_07240 [Candidatus Aminicenantes bacterium]|nr:MAG: hypothetical protein JSV88_07240 [Candidatus Aminicenantes bacterium]
MDKKKRSYFNVRLVIGLLITAAGILLLLDSLDIGFDVNVGDYWPVILIVIGLGKILQPKEHRQLYWGIIIMTVGNLFLLNNLGYIHFWFDNLWPILLILVGIEIIRCGFFKHKIRLACCTFHDKKKPHFKGWTGISDSKPVDDDYVDISVVLGGGEYKLTNKQLKGGRASVIMGGFDLDFRNADMEKDQIILEASVIMGGIDIRVPAHWQVVMQGSPVLGSMEDKTTKPESPAKKLIIKGSVILGAIEVKN